MYSKNENIYTYNLTIVPSGRDQKKGGSISRFMLAMLKVGGPRQKKQKQKLETSTSPIWVKRIKPPPAVST